MPAERNIVYSTNPDYQKDSDNSQKNESHMKNGQMVKIQREKKGRGGKTVAVLYGLTGDLKTLQKEIQKHCGTGGSTKNGTIEIQGDHGPKIKAFLDGRGFKAKLAGGY